MDRLRRSTVIFRELWTTLSHDKEVLFFPIASAIFAALGTGGVLFCFYARGVFGNGVVAFVLGLLAALAVYVATWVSVLFLDAALIRCVQLGIDGGTPTLGDGLLSAARRAPRLFQWAVVAGTVGVPLRLLEGHVKRLDRAVGARLGAPWTVASFFVLPAIVFDDLAVSPATARSRELVERVWGASFARRDGLAPLVAAGAVVSLLLPAAGLFAAGASGALTGGAIALVGVVALGVLASALHAMHLAVLFDYAATGELAEGVSEALAPVVATAP